MQIIDCDVRNFDSCLTEKGFPPEICSRHILVFGEEMQKQISSLTIGVISAGGLGSIIIEQLMRLFPGKLIIIDKDIIELSNLNRLVGATYLDAKLKTKKVDLAYRNILTFNNSQVVMTIHGDFLKKANQQKFRECDFIFGASDSITVRLATNRLCLAYGIPYLDCGTGAIVNDRTLQAAGGQIIKILPDAGFCLHCSGLFNVRESMSELLSDAERKRQENQGYIRGAQVTAPQVYSLNMMAASWAVWIFMQMVSGQNLNFDGVMINAKEFATHFWKERMKTNNDCPTCGADGIVFSGDNTDLLCKDDQDVISHDIGKDILMTERDYDQIIEATTEELISPSYYGLSIGNDANGLVHFKM